MFGGHLWELVIVLVLALVVFGPKRLPDLGSAMGKSIKEFRKGVDEHGDDAASPQIEAGSHQVSPPPDVAQATTVPGVKQPESVLPPEETHT